MDRVSRADGRLGGRVSLSPLIFNLLPCWPFSLSLKNAKLPPA